MAGWLITYLQAEVAGALWGLSVNDEIEESIAAARHRLFSAGRSLTSSSISLRTSTSTSTSVSTSAGTSTSASMSTRGCAIPRRHKTPLALLVARVEAGVNVQIQV